MNTNTILLKLLSYKWVKKVVAWLRKLVLPFFDGVPLFDVLVYFIKGLVKGELSIRAAALSYNFFMALFPLILFFFTIIAYLPLDAYIPVAYDFIAEMVPAQAYESVMNTINGILTKNGTLLSISIIFTFYFATRGIRAMIKTFNDSYHTLESRSGIMQIVISLMLLLVITIMIILVFTAIIINKQLFISIVSNTTINIIVWKWIFGFSKWILVVLFMFFSISLIYYLAPAKKSRFRFFSAGSSLATALIILSSFGFDFYISNFSNYNAVYGSIGTLIIVLVWIQLISMILIIGFELNASIKNAKRRKQMKSTDPLKLYTQK
ncbi:MAG: YihY/virulence factor BrkB family protein [Bacteroidales bacterium]|nr:YihY/virulence factor BrkB family protein [Bacteroidales bacterium]